MTTKTTIRFKKFMRLGIFSALMIAVVALAFASKGGGGNKKKVPSYKNDFVPIRTTTGFTMGSNVTYTGSHFFGVEKTDKSFSFNTVVTYQKGNTIYIMPFKYKVSNSVFNITTPKSNNFQMLNLKIKMHK